jgi:hypothetical protein
VSPRTAGTHIKAEGDKASASDMLKIVVVACEDEDDEKDEDDEEDEEEDDDVGCNDGDAMDAEENGEDNEANVVVEIAATRQSRMIGQSCCEA